jgi:hypothetical protein
MSAAAATRTGKRPLPSRVWRRVVLEARERLSVGGLPDALIIGAQRSGTTSLEAALRRHAAIRCARYAKEVHFFDNAWTNGEPWYRRYFVAERVKERFAAEHGYPLVALEATPYYLFHPDVPRRASMVVPDAKLIAVLRDPVERAFSQYTHERRIGAETAPTFEDALALEAERIGDDASRLVSDETFVSQAHQHASYVSRGLYAEQLERWLARYPRSRLLVLTSEHLFRDPRAALARICAFLGVPEDPTLSLPRENVSSDPTTMTEETRERLRGFYAEPNARLGSLFGEELRWP